jgi:hypothetical protein
MQSYVVEYMHMYIYIYMYIFFLYNYVMYIYIYILGLSHKMDPLSMMKHGYHLHIRLSPAAEQCKGSAGGFSPKSMSANSANLISTDSTVI